MFARCDIHGEDDMFYICCIDDRLDGSPVDARRRKWGTSIHYTRYYDTRKTTQVGGIFDASDTLSNCMCRTLEFASRLIAT